MVKKSVVCLLSNMSDLSKDLNSTIESLDKSIDKTVSKLPISKKIKFYEWLVNNYYNNMLNITSISKSYKLLNTINK